MKTLAEFVPHILFVVSQTFCGSGMVLLVSPLLAYLLGAEYGYLELLHAFPDVWGQYLKWATLTRIAVVGAGLFVTGMLLAEFWYRVLRKLGYHDDLNIQRIAGSASEAEQQSFFEQKAAILRYPHLHKLWEWENFQSSMFLYAEYSLIVFVPLYAVCLIVTFVSVAPTESTQVQPIAAVVTAFVLGLASVVFLVVMRVARQGKYVSFALTHAALYETAETIATAEQAERMARAAARSEQPGNEVGS